MEFTNFQNVSKDFKFFKLDEKFFNSEIVLGDLFFIFFGFLMFPTSLELIKF